MNLYVSLYKNTWRQWLKVSDSSKQAKMQYKVSVIDPSPSLAIHCGPNSSHRQCNQDDGAAVVDEAEGTRVRTHSSALHEHTRRRLYTHVGHSTRLPNAATAAERGQRVASHR